MWGLEGTVLLDETAEYARSLGVRGVPTNLVVDTDGTVRAFGVSRLDELHRAIDEMLQRH
jgi:predicted DsbA family dithiol-disulfide isomerase